MIEATETSNKEVVVLKALLLTTAADHINIPMTTTSISPLAYACSHGNRVVAELLLDANADPNTLIVQGDTPLNIAIENKHKGLVSLLIDHGAHLDHGHSHTAPMSALYTACCSGNLLVVERLVKEFSLDVNELSQTRRHEYPFAMACKMLNVDIVKWLIEQDTAQVNLVSTLSEEAPLHIVCRNFPYQPKSFEIVELLLRANADVYLRSGLVESNLNSNLNLKSESTECESGVTPLHCAVAGGSTKMVQLLLGKGHTDPTMAANTQWIKRLHERTTLRDIRLRPKRKAQTGKSYFGPKPKLTNCLAQAIRRGDIKVVRVIVDYMLKHNYDLSASDPDTGMTALHEAVLLNPEKHFDTMKIIKYLIEYGNVDVNTCEFRKQASPIVLAIEQGARVIVEYLLQNPNVQLGQRVALARQNNSLEKSKYHSVVEEMLKKATIDRKKSSFDVVDAVGEIKIDSASRTTPTQHTSQSTPTQHTPQSTPTQHTSQSTLSQHTSQ